MRKRFIIITVALGCLLFTECKSVEPKLSNLHKGTYDSKVAPSNILEVSVSVLPLVQEKETEEIPKTFFDLRDSLPHAYLKVIGSKTNDPDKLIELLKKPLSDPAKKKAGKKQTNYTEYKVRLAFSSIKRYYNFEVFQHENTRLNALNISVSIPEIQEDSAAHCYFYTIDRLENEFEEIDFGILERTQAVTINSKLSAQGELGSSFNNTNTNTAGYNTTNGSEKSSPVYDGKGVVVGAITDTGEFVSSRQNTNTNMAGSAAKLSANGEVSYLNAETLKEAVNTKRKVLKTGFSLLPKKLTIQQKGRPFVDISDNVYVTATLKFVSTSQFDNTVSSKDVYWFENLYGEDKQITKSDNLKFSVRNVNYVNCLVLNQDLVLPTQFEGSIRAVGNEEGDTGESNLEYDDRVTNYQIANTDGKSLTIDRNLFCKSAYKFTARIGRDSYDLKIEDPQRRELNIFIDDDPLLFRQWLIDNVQNPQIANLKSKKFKLYFENLAGNKIYIVKDSFTTTELANIKKIESINTEGKLE